MDVIFDSSTDWLALESSKCQNCKGNTFDESKSSTARLADSQVTERRYNSIVVEGQELTDRICLASGFSSCIDSFKFYLINYSQTTIELPIDGFLGLGRVEPFETGSLAQINYKRGPSFVHALQDAGLISETQFSFYLSQDPDKRFIHFGTPQTSSMKSSKTLSYIKMFDDLFWASGCQGFAFGPLLNDYSVPDLGENFVKNGQMYSIFDSGSATI